MSVCRVTYGLALAAVLLLQGCRHHAATRVAAALPPATASSGPVMVSVPPPSHRSTDQAEVVTASDIPVVKPVRPPRARPRRSHATAPTVVASAPPPDPVAAPPVVSAAAPTPAQSLGQLTSNTDDPAATRDAAAQALRRERDRIASMPNAVQTAHATEVDQARRFLKSASDSWNSSDYVATLALTTKARVLLDDLLK